MKWFLLSWFLSLMLCWGPALAAPDDATVLVIAIDGSDPDELALQWAVRAAIGESVGLENVDLPSLLDVDLQSALEVGRRKAEEGSAALDQFDLPTAKTTLLEASLYLTGHPGAESEACTILHKLAETHLGLNDKDAVREVLIRSLHVASCAETPTHEWSPSMRALRREAQTIVDEREMGQLRVKAGGVPVVVFINGRFVGLSGSQPLELPSGPNHVRVVADGFGEENRVVKVKPGRTATLSAKLQKASRAGLLERILKGLPEHIDDEEFPVGLSELKALSFAQQGILVERRGEHVRAALYDLKRNLRVRAVQVSDDRPVGAVGRALVKALYQGFNPQRPGLSEAQPEAETIRPSADSGVPTWLWYAIAGSAAVLAGAFIVLANEGEDGIRREPGTGSLVLQF